MDHDRQLLMLVVGILLILAFAALTIPIFYDDGHTSKVTQWCVNNEYEQACNLVFYIKN